MDNREMINRIASASQSARQTSVNLLPVLKSLNTYTTPDAVVQKNMDLADSLMKFIQDSEELQAMLQQHEELV